MFNTLFSGYAPFFDGDNTKSKDGIPEALAASLQAYSDMTVLQTGFFTPTISGDHAFSINSPNGSYMAIDGQVLIDTNSTSGTSTNTITSLVAGQPYSFVYSAPFGAFSLTNMINSVSLSVSGGASGPLQNTQFSSPTDLVSNPTNNPYIPFASVFDGSFTPPWMNPVANVLPTNVMSNTDIATVPNPAIIPGITAAASNSAYNTLPVPMPVVQPAQYDNPTLSYKDDIRPACVMPVLIDNPSVSPPMPAVISPQTQPSVVAITPPPPAYKNTSPVVTTTYIMPELPLYIAAQQIGMEVTGMIPNTRISVFFDGVNVTRRCAPAVPEGQNLHNLASDVDWRLKGAMGDPIVTDSTGSAVAVFYLPEHTYTTGSKNIAFFNYTNDTDVYATRLANNTCSAFSTFSAANFDGKDQDDIVVFATAPTRTTSSSNTSSGRGGGNSGGTTVVTYNVEPMCQTFYVGSDMAQGQDGIYLSSVDLYFSAKSSTQPVTVEIRTTDENGPTSTAIPYSTVTMPSASVIVAPSASSNSSFKTKFNFIKPVFLKAGYTYAVAVNPGGQSPDYSIWTATAGKTTAAGAVTSNWGRGMLYTSTTNGSNWNPVQNQFMKFAINRTQHDSNYLSNATAVMVNEDYEFLTYMNHSKIGFQVGEYVYQQPTAHIAICSVNTTSNTLTLNTSAYGDLSLINSQPLKDFAVNDHIVICGSFPSVDPEGLGRFNYNLFGNAVTLKVMSVDANGQYLTFGYANGAAITGAPWSNGAMYVYKAQPGHVSYDPSSTTVVGTGTRFDIYQNTNERNNTDKRPLIIHVANSTVARHEVLWPNTVTNSTSITLKSVPRNVIPANSIAIPVNAPAAKVVKIDHSRNLIVLEKSTANNNTGGNSAANAYATTSFFAAGRTLVGTSSGATAIVAGVHNMIINSAQPVVHTTAPQGTAITYTANMTASDYTSVSYNSYDPDATNYFTNNQIIVASRTNEVVQMANNKSVQIIATLTSNSSLLSPTLDLLNNSGLLIKTNLINSSAIGENKNNGMAKSKSITKVITLADGNDAEDINVYLTAYKPLGTNIIVYAKVLNSADAEKFEDKDWSILQMVDGVSLYSDSTNQNDYKEYRYTFPTNPITIPSFQLLTTNNTANIVSTNADTKWQSVFRAGQLVTLYSDVYGTNYEVNQISTVTSNTAITLANPVTLSNTTSAIIATMPFPYSAFKNKNNGNIVRYYTADGSPRDSFKKFAIKIVFTAQNDSLVPKVRDIRALALSV